MRLSIVIPTAGNNPFRARNFEQCLKSIKAQTFSDYEIIVVEQSLDGKFYKGGDDSYRHVKIKDPDIRRGFNLSWCRNVGARHATGDKLVLMDADMVFKKEYFSTIDKDPNPFAGGAKCYYWIREEAITSKYIETLSFESVYESSTANHLDPVFKFDTFTNGCGYGAVLVFDRSWYWESFGGYPEDFFKYGWEDKAAIQIIKHSLGIINDADLPKIDYEIVHLSHGDKNYTNLNTNQGIYNKIKNADKDKLISILKSSELGDLDSPKIILNKI